MRTPHLRNKKKANSKRKPAPRRLRKTPNDTRNCSISHKQAWRKQAEVLFPRPTTTIIPNTARCAAPPLASLENGLKPACFSSLRARCRCLASHPLRLERRWRPSDAKQRNL